MDRIDWFVSASVIILIVIALRAALGRRMSAGLRYALWGLVLLRLLVPGTVFHSAFSVANAVECVQYTVPAERASAFLSETAVYSGTMPDTQLSPEEAERTHGGEIYKIHGYSAESGKSDLRTYFFRDSLRSVGGKLFIYIWYAGIAVTALSFTASNLRLLIRLKQRRRRIEVACPLPVYAVENLSSSCLFGRAVYVSAETAGNSAQLRHVLAHELSHYRHGDSLWAVLRCMALALHWFNPLVWWAALLSRRDCELFADAAAVKTLGEDAREDYGVTLIQLSARCGKKASLLCTATTMTSGKKALKERIRSIAKRTRMTAAVWIAVVLIAALAVGCAFTGAKKSDTEEPVDTMSQEITTTGAPETVSEEITPLSVSVNIPYSSNSNAYRIGYASDDIALKEKYDAYVEMLRNAVPTEEKFGAQMYEISFELPDADPVSFFISGNGVVHFSNDETVYQVGTKYYTLFDTLFRQLEGHSAFPSLPSLTVEYAFDYNVPERVAEIAADYVKGEVETYQQLGETDGYQVEAAKIIGLTHMNTGTASEYISVDMYLLEYRIRVDHPENVVLVGGMKMEDGCITEWGSTGQRYLIFLTDEDGTVQQIGVTNTDRLQFDYSTPNMLEKYGNCYTAACMELSAAYRSPLIDLAALQKSDPERFAELVLSWQENLNLPTQVTVDKAYDYDAVIQAWAEALAACYVSDSLSADNPYRCTEATVNYAGAGIKQISLVTSRPQELAFDCCLLLRPCDIERYQIMTNYSNKEFEAGVIFDYAEYVLRSEDGYTWTLQSKGWGGVGWRGYRLLTFVDVDMKVLLDNITEAYRNGKVSGLHDQLLYAGEFIPWSELTTDQFNAVYEALKEAAIDESYPKLGPIHDDHLYRDLYMMYAAAKTDGAYAELFSDVLLPMQYENDPDAFLAALEELPEEIYTRIAPIVYFIR